MKKKYLIMVVFVSFALTGCSKQTTETVAVFTAQEVKRAYPADELLEKYYKQGNFEKAITYAESALNDITWGYVKDEDRISWINAMIGDCYLELGQYEDGKTYIDIAIRECENSDKLPQNFYNISYIEGRFYLKTNQYKTAIECFDNSIKYIENLGDTGGKVEMDVARIYCDMGNTYIKMKDMDSALEMLKNSHNIVSKWKLESESAYTYYENVLVPALKDLFEYSSDGEIEYDEWFSEQF